MRLCRCIRTICTLYLLPLPRSFRFSTLFPAAGRFCSSSGLPVPYLRPAADALLSAFLRLGSFGSVSTPLFCASARHGAEYVFPLCQRSALVRSKHHFACASLSTRCYSHPLACTLCMTMLLLLSLMLPRPLLFYVLQYTLRAIPVGGYVSFPNNYEVDDDGVVTELDDPDLLYNR